MESLGLCPILYYRFVMAAAREIAEIAKDYVVIVTKSTVPVGTNRQVKQVVKKTNPDLDFDAPHGRG